MTVADMNRDKFDSGRYEMPDIINSGCSDHGLLIQFGVIFL